jgi:hypothetical protein
MNAKAKKVSNLRIGAGVALATVGLSLAGSVAPAVASADPWVPFSGPLRPVRHCAADVLHPVWALRHPVRAPSLTQRTAGRARLPKALRHCGNPRSAFWRRHAGGPLCVPLRRGRPLLDSGVQPPVVGGRVHIAG